MRECEDVNIPRVNNDELECNKYYKAECTYLTNLRGELTEYFDLDSTPKLEDVLITMMETIQDMRERISILENI